MNTNNPTTNTTMKTNETNTPEPLDAILAEMREAGRSDEHADGPLIEDYADRIEAAVRSDIAAIRTALFRATEMLDQVYKHSGLTPSMRESIAEAVLDADAVLKATPQPPKRFDEAAFDAAVSKPNGWSGVADPVAEIRRMRDGDTPGNAAAMREALERIVRYEDGIVGCIESGHASGVDWDGITFAMIQAAKDALAAPARNCDIYPTAEEAYAAWQKHNSLTAICDWLFAPAEGKEADNG